MEIDGQPWSSFERVLEMREKEKGKVLEELRVTARVWRFKRGGFWPNGPNLDTCTLFRSS